MRTVLGTLPTLVSSRIRWALTGGWLAPSADGTGGRHGSEPVPDPRAKAEAPDQPPGGKQGPGRYSPRDAEALAGGNRPIEMLLRLVNASAELPAVIGRLPALAGSADPKIAALQAADLARNPSYFVSTLGGDRKQQLWETISRLEFDQLREAGVPLKWPDQVE